MIDDYVNDLKFIFNEKRLNEDDQRTLYQTMLGMQDWLWCSEEKNTILKSDNIYALFTITHMT